MQNLRFISTYIESIILSSYGFFTNSIQCDHTGFTVYHMKSTNDISGFFSQLQFFSYFCLFAFESTKETCMNEISSDLNKPMKSTEIVIIIVYYWKLVIYILLETAFEQLDDSFVHRLSDYFVDILDISVSVLFKIIRYRIGAKCNNHMKWFAIHFCNINSLAQQNRSLLKTFEVDCLTWYGIVKK